MDLEGNILKRSFAFLPDPMDREVWGFPVSLFRVFNPIGFYSFPYYFGKQQLQKN